MEKSTPHFYFWQYAKNRADLRGFCMDNYQLRNRFSLLFTCTLSTTPMERYNDATDVPPADRKGKVIPITGNIPRFIPILIAICAANIEKTPTQIYRPRSSVAFFAFHSIERQRIESKISTPRQPTKPRASPMKEKIKSLCTSGTY